MKLTIWTSSGPMMELIIFMISSTLEQVSETQEIGAVIDKHFKIKRKHEETIGCYELRETNAHEEQSRIMTALNKQQAKADAEASFVQVPAGTGVGTPEFQRAAHMM